MKKWVGLTLGAVGAVVGFGTFINKLSDVQFIFGDVLLVQGKRIGIEPLVADRIRQPCCRVLRCFDGVATCWAVACCAALNNESRQRYITSTFGSQDSGWKVVCHQTRKRHCSTRCEADVPHSAVF